jgi:hypothetical protein
MLSSHRRAIDRKSDAVLAQTPGDRGTEAPRAAGDKRDTPLLPRNGKDRLITPNARTRGKTLDGTASVRYSWSRQ